VNLESNPNQMVVEGYDDQYSVVGLMSAHVDWPDDVKKAPVYIHIGNGADEILKDGFLSTFLKSPVIRRLGVMLDADQGPEGRYERFRARCLGAFSELPPKLPEDGLVVENEQQMRLGLWIMPDNSSEGSLETFLRYLVPDPSGPIWNHAINSVQRARTIGCPCRDAHIAKANLYTWLSWQDPPGQSPGKSLTKKVLDPHSESAERFVRWFRSFYGL